MVKFLIIRFSSIGDILLTTPVIRGIKEHVEDAEVHILVKKQFLEVVKNNPYIDKVHIFEGDLNKTAQELKQELFHYAIDLQNSIRSYRLKNKLKVLAFTVDKLNMQKWLMVNFKMNRLPNKHIVERYLDTVHLFDVENDGKGLDFIIPEESEIQLSQLPDYLKSGFFTVTVGAGHYTKQMPAEDIAALLNKIQKPVVLLGSEAEAEKGKLIARNSSAPVYNGCGMFHLNESASLIKQSRFLIAHDTGLMHIGAAFKKDIISLWGNTIPEFGMYPWKPGENSRIIENTELKCRPCTKIGYHACPKKHFKCMKDLDKNSIADTAKNLWEINAPES